MPEILLGVVVLVRLLWAGGAFIKADPKQVALVLRGIGGVAALLLAAFLLFRDAIGVAIPLGAFGLGLLGWVSFWPASFGARTQRSTGQASRVRTAFLKWNSITIPAECMAKFSPAAIRGGFARCPGPSKPDELIERNRRRQPRFTGSLS
jgi:hypothetical protein